MMLACMAARRMAQCRRGQPEQPCDPLAAIPGPGKAGGLSHGVRTTRLQHTSQVSPAVVTANS